jgi:hypothetical protein
MPSTPTASISQGTNFIFITIVDKYRLSSLVFKVPDYKSRGLGFDSLRYQIVREEVGLERGSLLFVRIIEELFEWKSGSSGLEN